MNKLTKIIATIGPSSDAPEIIEKLIKEGVNIFRFNFKHNAVSWHQERIKRVQHIAGKLHQHIATLIDLQGPEIRIRLSQDELDISEGDVLWLGTLDSHAGKGFAVSHPEIVGHLKKGQTLIADDGAFMFTVEKEGEPVKIRALNSGVLKNNKSLNIPGADFPFPVLVEKDLAGISLAAKYKVDFVALSFVRSAEDINVLREQMSASRASAHIVAKIETQKALSHLPAILEAADAVMVARGDLGVELPMEQVPAIQKDIIKRCIEMGVSVITATQMLESMTNHFLPTRAEVSDVANAVYDYTDAIMLSGETALGKYPIRAVQVMAKTASYNEKNTRGDVRSFCNFVLRDQEERMCDAAYQLYRQSANNSENIKMFVAFTQSGRTARLLSRYRPQIPIIAFCPTEKIARVLSINYGIYPFVQEVIYEKSKAVTPDDVLTALHFLTGQGILNSGEKAIVLHGDQWAVEGGTSTVKIVTV